MRKLIGFTSLIMFLCFAGGVSADTYSLTLANPGNNTWTSDVTPDFSFTAVSNVSTVSCELFVDGSGFGLNASTNNNTLTTITANASLSEGARNWLVNCTDADGSNQSQQRVLNVDTTSPSSTINTANGTTTNDATPEINFTLTDNLDGTLDYTFFVDGVVNVTGSATNNTATLVNISDLNESTHTIIVQATDEANNSVNSSILTLTVDVTDPNLSTSAHSITNISAVVNVTSDETATFTVFYGTTSMSYTNTQAGSTALADNITISSLAPSTQYFFVSQGCDAANNCANTTENNFTTASNPAAPSSGGGGGGGSGGGISGASISSKPEKRTLSPGRAFNFNIPGESRTHRVMIKNIQEDGVLLVISSDPIEVFMKAGESKTLDLNGDKKMDLKITLESHTKYYATVILEAPEVKESPSSVKSVDEIQDTAEEAPSAPPPAEEAPELEVLPTPEPEEKESVEKGVSGGVIAVILILLLGAFLVFFRRKNNQVLPEIKDVPHEKHHKHRKKHKKKH